MVTSSAAKPRNAGNFARKPARRPGGRPSLFKPEYVDQAAKLCSLGATTEDLADFFRVSIRTVENWIAFQEEFGKAVREAKSEFADAHVERALYRRARGYSYDSQKVFQYKGKIVRAEVREHVPPDTQAMTFWLMNRKSAEWRSRQELTGAGGGPIQTIDVSGLTPVERAQRIAALATMNGGAGPVVEAKPTPTDRA